MNKGSGTQGNERRRVHHRLRTTIAGLVLTSLLAACGQAQLAAPDVKPGEATDNDGAVTEFKLNSSHAQERGFFGDSLAMSGDTLVVGAWGENIRGEESGAAYVFVRAGSGWQLQAELRASDAGPEHRFGHAVAISGDTIVVGAVYHDQNGFRAGAAYLFERQGDSWTERAILTPQDAAEYQHFGTSVALDEHTIVIGAGGFAARAAYVFERADTQWIQVAKLEAPISNEGDRFGNTVALSGNTIAVGAWNDAVIDEDEEFEDDDAFFAADTIQSGTVHMFVRNDAGWSHSAVLTSGAELRQGFGWSLDLHDDTLVVGAPELNDAYGTGAAYVFTHDNGAWSLQSILSPLTGHDFGWSVAVDGHTILVGAPSEEDNAGAGYVYRQQNGTWEMARRIHASDTAEALHFGGAVTVSAGYLVFGATGDQTGGLASGAAYVYY